MKAFARAVRQRTDGQVNIQLTSYTELGISPFDMIDLINDGTVGFGEIHGRTVAEKFPIFEVASLRGMFPDTATYFEAVDAVSDDLVEVIREETNGGEVVAFNFDPSSFFYTKDPIDHLADFRGLRVRSPNAVLSDLLSGSGADPQSVALAEVHAALEGGIIDGAVTCGSCGHEHNWYEVARYLTGPIPGSATQTFLTFNADVWNSLTPEIRAIIREEGAVHTAKSRASVFDLDAEAIELLTAEGMEYAEFTEDLIDAFQFIAKRLLRPFGRHALTFRPFNSST
jgi:TRAP-type C4-dicarboxylate transport system substrate-binding protein